MVHPRRPRDSQSGREKWSDERFQARAEEPLGTDSHRNISKRSSEYWLLIEHNNTKHFLCPIRSQSQNSLDRLEIVWWESLPRGSSARAWKLSLRLFSQPDWLPLGLRGCTTTWNFLISRARFMEKVNTTQKLPLSFSKWLYRFVVMKNFVTMATWSNYFSSLLTKKLRQRIHDCVEINSMFQTGVHCG